MERRLKANLKHVQPGDELGTRRAKILTELQAQQWFDLVRVTDEHDRYVSSEDYQSNLECLETGGSDIGAFAQEAALQCVLMLTLEAMRKWLPE